jgi:hypothetical protein
MRTATFDTHAHVKRLVAAGFTETQAEALIQVASEMIGEARARTAALRQERDRDQSSARISAD